MSVLSDMLTLLGLVGPGGAPAPAVDVMPVWVPLELSVDETLHTPPFTYQVLSRSREIAKLDEHLALTKPVPLTFAALKASNLLQPDPADATKYQVKLTLRIEYPALPSSPKKLAGKGKLPVVLINHGHHRNWQPTIAGGAITAITATPNIDGYKYLQDALAEHGIVSVSVDHNFACATNALIEMRADTIIAALNALSTEASSSSSRYHGRLDFSKIGLMGHSRGGDAVVRAVKKILAEPSLSAKFKILTVCSLAPTDYTGADVPGNRMFLDSNDVNFYLVVYGALDNDVFGGGPIPIGGSGFRHYDRARPPKAMVFLDNSCHNAFNTVWFADGNDSTDPRLASDAEHRSLAVDYIGDLFRWQLGGEKLGARFDGRTPNRAGQHASFQWMFGQALVRVDDFENPAANLLGGARVVINGPSDPTAIEDFGSITIAGNSLAPHTEHQAHVLHVDLTLSTPATTRVLTTEIPAANRDWSALDTLVFSLSGWFDPTSAATITAANLPRLQVTLVDGAGASAAVGFNAYGASLPSRPVFKTKTFLVPGNVVTWNVTLIRLETIPIALSSFAGVDLTKIAQVALDIVPDNDTHVFADNIHVVKRQ
ncbi:MAG: hypothetical protein ABSB69_04215 [Solirubrobacteraceae bacterium]